jgi:hypothetical protein
MKKLLPALLVATICVVFIACQKEVSFEVDGNPAQGSLQEDGGGLCLPKTVNGSYIAGTALNPANNTISIQVDVAQTGSYSIKSDTINGYHFVGTGSFTSTGMQAVTLKGSGTPLVQGNNVFTIFFDSTACDITVQVLPSGSGGPAAFTLAGAGGGCTTPTISGDYIIGTALAAGNTVVLTVNVTTIGTYNLTTTAVQGMTFTGSGTLAATGNQTITLTGSGTPVAPAGNVSIAVTAGGGTCNFTINLLSTAPVGDYFPRTANSNWSYEFDDVSADSILLVATNLTHTVGPNVYTIFAATPDAAQGFDSAGYYRKNGGDYYRYTNLADYIGFDNDQYQEFIFLKDNLAAGQTWTSPGFAGLFSGTPVTIRLKYRIVQQNVNYPLTTSTGVVTYQNVIAVEEKYEKLVGGNWVDATADMGGYYVDYYARGIGWILSESYDPTNALDLKMEMRRHVVF